jgi:hypothetical protein
MPQSLPTKSDVARPRLRSAITTIVLIALSVLIVRDILVRRWSSASSPSNDVTQRSR